MTWNDGKPIKADELLELIKEIPGGATFARLRVRLKRAGVEKWASVDFAPALRELIDAGLVESVKQATAGRLEVRYVPSDHRWTRRRREPTLEDVFKKNQAAAGIYSGVKTEIKQRRRRRS